MSDRASGAWLVAAAALFWLAWWLMPGVGVTDAARIMELVSARRDAVWWSTVAQLASAACFAPAVVGLGRLAREEDRRGIAVGAALLAAGAMGSAADAIFHLLAYQMTAPGTDTAAMIPLMERMQGPGLALVLPLVAAFFAGVATLGWTCSRAGIGTRWNPALLALGIAVALAGGFAARGDPALARATGLLFLGFVSASLGVLGVALARRSPDSRAPNLNQVTVACKDLEVSAEFYRRLGLRQIVASPPDYARFECPDGLATFSLHRAELAHDAAPVVYFEIADLDGFCRELAARDIRLEQAPTDQSWLWREAYLRDPAGNLICLYRAGRHRRFPPWRLPGRCAPSNAR